MLQMRTRIQKFSRLSSAFHNKISSLFSSSSQTGVFLDKTMFFAGGRTVEMLQMRTRIQKFSGLSSALQTAVCLQCVSSSLQTVFPLLCFLLLGIFSPLMKRCFFAGGRTVEMLQMRTRIQKFSRLSSVMPNCHVSTAPNCVPNTPAFIWCIY